MRLADQVSKRSPREVKQLRYRFGEDPLCLRNRPDDFYSGSVPTTCETIGRLEVSKPLARFVAHRLAPCTGVSSERFWSFLAKAVERFGPIVGACLSERGDLQARIDSWHRGEGGQPPTPPPSCALSAIWWMIPGPFR